jgi:hypothetical protein
VANKIEVILSAYDQSKSAFDSFKSNSQGLFSEIKQHWLEITAAIATVYTAYKKLAGTVDDTQRLANETYKLQRMTGMTAEAASEMIAVSDHMGVSFDSLSSSIMMIARRMGGLKGIEDMVVDASGKTVDIFEKYHVAVKNADGSTKSLTDVFGQIRKKIQEAGDQSERLRIATQFFRMNAVELLPVLTLSDSKWKELAEDAKKYGIILSAGNVNAVRQYTMAHRDLDDAILGLKLTIGNELIPMLTESTKKLAEATAGVRGFIKENKTLLSLPWEALRQIKEDFEAIKLAVAALIIVRFGPTVVAWIASLIGLRSALALTVVQAEALTAALGILAGYELGKAIDELIYKLSKGKIDISGMQSLNNTLRSTAEQTEFAAGKQEKYNKILSDLGFIGPTAMKEFSDAVAKGEVIFDRASGKWKRLADSGAAAAAASEEQKKAFDKLVAKIQELRAAMADLENPVEGNRIKLEQFIKETIKGVAETPKLRKAIADLRMAFAETETAKIQDVLKEKVKELSLEYEKLQHPLEADALAMEQWIEKVQKSIETLKSLPEEKRLGVNIGDIEAKIGEIRNLVDNLDAYEKELTDIAKISAAYENQKTLEKNLTDVMGSELDKRIVDIRTWEKEQIRLSLEAAKGEIDATGDTEKAYEENEARKLEITKATGKQIVDATTAYNRQIRDLELQNQLAVIDIKEKTFQISEGEAVQEKLDKNNEYVASLQKEYDATIGIAEKDEYRAELLTKIRDIQKEIVDLQLRQEELTDSIADGWKRGLQEFAKEMPTSFQQGVDLAKTALGGLQDTLSNMSFDALKGKFKGWADYVTSLCDIITKKMLDMMAQWLLFGEGGKGGLGGLFGLLGIGGAPQPQTPSPSRGGEGGLIPGTGYGPEWEIDATKATGQFTGVFDSFIGGLGSVFKDVLGGFGGVFKDLLSGLGSVLGSIVQGIAGFIGGLFHQGGLVMHAGGVIPAEAGIQRYYIPRFHFGGLNDDERMTINKVGERYITAEQNDWLTSLGNAIKNLPTLTKGGEGGFANNDNRSWNISVPVTVEGNNQLAGEMRNEVEQAVIRVLRRHS